MTTRQQLATTAADLDPATLTREQFPPEPTPWGRFLDHAMDCADCREGERCSPGDELRHAVRAVLTAAAP
ncbi:hypothetical protein ACFZCY_05955 [Streptomyces sp. NPDC007983]|uniref:hypothetical protein n=1 Tax=Streptomyces sp. NPDC007983 TaxID=3364800 RepID=UPI0036E2E086